MEICPGIEIIGLSLWLKKHKILVLSDFHLGYEEYLHHKGILVPKFQTEETIARLKPIFKKVKPKLVIINGDLKHEFGRVLNQEWNEMLKLVDFLLKNGQKLILIKGNHDQILGSIVSKKNLQILPEYQVNGILICHGDKVKPTGPKIKTIIIGHEHPAISFNEKSKIEKYKCFLQGKWKNKRLIVMPSFNPLLEGTDIIKEKLLSPYLTNLSGFKVLVIGQEEIFDFSALFP